MLSHISSSFSLQSPATSWHSNLTLHPSDSAGWAVLTKPLIPYVKMSHTILNILFGKKNNFVVCQCLRKVTKIILGHCVRVRKKLLIMKNWKQCIYIPKKNKLSLHSPWVNFLSLQGFFSMFFTVTLKPWCLSPWSGTPFTFDLVHPRRHMKTQNKRFMKPYLLFLGLVHSDIFYSNFS